MAFGRGSFVSGGAGRADVEFRANVGQFRADVTEARRVYQQSTGQMTDAALRMAVAQEKLDRAIARFGPESRQAKEATLAYRREMRALEDQSRRSDAGLSRVRKTLGGLTSAFGVGAGALGVAGFVFALRSAIRASVEFESAFAGVRKTVDATEAEFAVLSDEIRALAREIPIAATELARIAELGGQLGIDKSELIDFTRTVADLGQTTDLSVEQAATALAQLAAITRLPQSQLDRLGSTTVALGNNFATTESKIIDFALRIAAAGKIIGLTEAQSLATAAAFASVGVEAEAGGTAVSKVFISLANAVKSGGAELELFARTAGMSVSEFRSLFERDAASAFVAFVEGLRRVDREGGNVFKTLTDLGLTDQRLTRAFLSMSQAGGLLRRSLELGSRAWEENIALTEEAEKRYLTSESRLQLFHNRVNDLRILVGDALVPALLDLIEPISAWLDEAENQERVQKAVNDVVEDGAEIVRGLASALREIADVAGPVIGALGGIENAAKLLFIALAVRKFLVITGAVKGLRVGIALLGPTAVTSSATTVTALNTIGVASLLNAGRVATLRAALAGLGLGGVAAGGAAKAGGLVAGLGVVKGLNELDKAIFSSSTQELARQAADVMERQSTGARRRTWKNLSPTMRAAVAQELRRRNRHDILAEVGAAQVGGAETQIVAPGEGNLGGPERLGPTKSGGTAPPSGGGGERPQPRTPLDIELDIARAQARGDQAAEARLLRELRARYQRQIDRLEANKGSLDEEQKKRLQELYSRRSSVQSQLDSLATEGERAREERERLAKQRRQQAQQEARERRERAERRRQERLDRREQALENRISGAELRGNLAAERRALQELVAFYREQARNLDNSLKARQEYAKKRIDTQKKLKELRQRELERAIDDGTITAAERKRLRAVGGSELVREAVRRAKAEAGAGGAGGGAFDQIAFLNSLRGITNQFGGNLFPPGTFSGQPGAQVLELEGLGQVATHAVAQTDLLRQVVRSQAKLARGVASPGARYARIELAAAHLGTGF